MELVTRKQLISIKCRIFHSIVVRNINFMFANTQSTVSQPVQPDTGKVWTCSFLGGALRTVQSNTNFLCTTKDMPMRN